MPLSRADPGMQELRYQRPTTIAEAATLLAADGARALAGGTDLIPQMREGRRAVSGIVDLKHVPELIALERTSAGGWRIGAALGIGRLGANEEFAAEHSALLDAARLIGSLQVHNRASLGGNLCNAAPSADAVPLLIALGAQAIIAGSAGTRTIPVEAVPTGPGRTSLLPGEFVTSIELPPMPRRSAARYLRFTPRREMDIAVAGAGVSLTLDAGGKIAAARIALASVAPIPLRAAKAETVLIGALPLQAAFTAAGDEAAREARPISDTRGSAEYRRELVAVLTRRALTECAQRLGASAA